MVKICDAAYLKRVAAAIFTRCGSPPAEAAVVADLLVQADLMGLHSHGVLRLSQYVGDSRSGAIVPGAPVVVKGQTATAAIVDAQWNFGQVAAVRATELALKKAAEQGMGCAVLRRCRHVGRVGAYVEMVARSNGVGLATCSTAGEGHWVAPFGGRQGRLGTNPIAFAAPTGGDPILMDFSTSALPEGRVRLSRDTAKTLPPDCLVDGQGQPSTDPTDLYAADGTAAGAITSFGGAQGYKSFGLSLMVQVLSSLLAAPAWREEGLESNANTMWIMAINIEALMAAETFRDELDQMLQYICGSAPAVGSDGVLVPGQREFETMARYRREGIPLEEGVWRQVAALATELEVPLDE